jgi:glycine amidinotransferase
MIKMHDVSVIYDRPALSSAVMSSAGCPVNSWNEWDPLEEVIVGLLDGAVVPPFHVSVTYNRPHSTGWLHRFAAGRRYPRWMVRRAQTELDGFVRLLEAEGVHVRRPEPIDQRRRVHTRLWSSRGAGFRVILP